MKIKTILITCLLVVSGVVGANAQGKMGYVDETYIIGQLPEYKTVEAEMKTYQDQVQAELKSMRDNYDKKVEEFKQFSAQPNPSKPILEARYKEIQELEKQITELQQSASQEYQQELNKKLAPLYEKMKGAVDQVASEQGGIFILRREATVYQVEENNLSDAVLKKLGVTPTETVANRGNLKSQNKVGVFDVNATLSQLPEAKQADDALKLYQEKLRENIQKLQQEFQQQVAILEDEELPEARKQEITAKAEELQKQILDEQQKAQDAFTKKQQSLLEPLYKKIQDAMTEVAKSSGYTYILRLETSLFEPGNVNITDDVLKKLGVDPAQAASNPSSNK